MRDAWCYDGRLNLTDKIRLHTRSLSIMLYYFRFLGLNDSGRLRSDPTRKGKPLIYQGRRSIHLEFGDCRFRRACETDRK
jgi:hypothetical protein